MLALGAPRGSLYGLSSSTMEGLLTLDSGKTGSEAPASQQVVNDDYPDRREAASDRRAICLSPGAASDLHSLAGLGLVRGTACLRVADCIVVVHLFS